jgi:hypothetical protein
MDAAMMLVSIAAVTVLHPCYFFPYLGLKKNKKNQGKAYERFQMENSALGGQPQQQGHV